MKSSFVWLVIAALLLLSALSALGQWELKFRQDEHSRRITSVHFITPTQGWTNGAGIYWTDDGGESWEPRNLDIIWWAFFLNPHDGWQRAFTRHPEGGWRISKPTPMHEYPPKGAEISFQRSFDGGLSWEENTGIITDVVEMNDPVRREDVRRFSSNSFRFHFLDSWTGFVAGVTDLYGGFPDGAKTFRAFYLGKTTDGGETWKLHIHWGPWRTLGGSVKEIEFFDDQHGLIMTSHPSILYRTSDGGNTWSSNDPELGMAFISIEFVSLREGWLSASNGDGSGELRHTVDGGETWQVISRVRFGAPGDVLFINPQRGWLILNGQAPELGIEDKFRGILHTRNGGTTWNVELDITAEQGTSLLYLTHDPLTQTLWATGSYETIYKRTESVTNVSPQDKLPSTWGQVKQP